MPRSPVYPAHSRRGQGNKGGTRGQLVGGTVKVQVGLCPAPRMFRRRARVSRAPTTGRPGGYPSDGSDSSRFLQGHLQRAAVRYQWDGVEVAVHAAEIDDVVHDYRRRENHAHRVHLVYTDNHIFIEVFREGRGIIWLAVG